MSIKAQAHILQLLQTGQITWDQVEESFQRREEAMKEVVLERTQELDLAVKEEIQDTFDAQVNRMAEWRKMQAQMNQVDGADLEHLENKKIDLASKTKALSESLEAAESSLKEQSQKIAASAQTIQSLQSDLQNLELNKRDLKGLVTFGQKICGLKPSASQVSYKI